VNRVGIDASTNKNIRVKRYNIYNLPADMRVHAVYCSHTLEHLENPIGALKEFHRILRRRGYLFVAVPPYKAIISPEHITMGWNIGQLWYNLSLAGFDCNNGQFKETTHSIFAIVRKSRPKTQYDKIFKKYPIEGSMVANSTVRYKANITKYNWKELK
jgi:ubiquinone/menaquinone biosynthesis C-methylase UbiE